MHTFKALAIASALTFAISSQAAVYDNGGLVGTSATNIGFGVLVPSYATSDSFELATASTFDTAYFGSWVPYANKVEFLSWSIGTSFFDNSIASGIAVPVTNRSLGFNGVFALNETSFSFAPVNLAAGTYYLTLRDARNDAGGTVFWDVTKGASLSRNSDQGTIDSHSFKLVSSVPEPGSLLMLAGGLALFCGVFGRRLKANKP
ncbi:MAG: PEP-CTERM sorting domain-containing protein [Curvibacter sp.]|nr:MAG: PEP-CTERM sorting domain-containing protein [Curvibacter sp.]